MKVLVTGASGMLGIQVCRIASQELGKGNVVAMTHADMDITEPLLVKSVLESAKPDVIINCAGIVRGRALRDVQYMMVNATGPRILAELAEPRGIKVVQISSDCVFDGSAPQTEQGSPRPVDVYGRSKVWGELKAPHLTVRISFVGLGQRGLLAWFMRQKEVQGYTGALWNGLTTPWAARKILKAAQANMTGVLHLFGEDTTKYHLLQMANETMGLGITVTPTNTVHSDMRLRSLSSFNDQYPAPPLQEQLIELARMR